MQRFGPVRAEALVLAQASVVVPGLVEVVGKSIGTGRPHEQRGGLGERAESGSLSRNRSSVRTRSVTAWAMTPRPIDSLSGEREEVELPDLARLGAFEADDAVHDDLAGGQDGLEFGK